MISSPDLSVETVLWTACRRVAGLDEAGRGALAGPVCVGAVIFPHDNPRLRRTLGGVRDSKQMTPRQRSQLAPRIKDLARDWGVGYASADEIDSMGIVPATRLAACRALESFSIFPDYLLTDFRLELPELELSQSALVKGDRSSLSIAAASILAKTARDELMIGLDAQFPAYGFSRHKGYGTVFHRRQVRILGYSPAHRRTFQVKNG